MLTCTCSPLSAFRWRERLQPSLLAGDHEVKYSQKSGMTPSQHASANKAEFQQRTGHELGEVLAAKVVHRG